MNESVSTLSSEKDIYKEIGVRLKFIIKMCSSNTICDDGVYTCMGEYAVDIIDLYAMLKEKGCTSKFVVFNKDDDKGE